MEHTPDLLSGSGLTSRPDDEDEDEDEVELRLKKDEIFPGLDVLECFDDLRCFSLSCTALHSTAASKAELLTPSSVICVPVLGSLHLYVRFRQFILSSGILHFSRICFMKSSSPSCPVLTLHRKLMLLNLTMMSPLTLSGAGLGCDRALPSRWMMRAWDPPRCRRP